MVDQYQKQLETFLTTIDRELEAFPPAKELEKATGVKKSYFAIGGAAFVAILIFFNIAGQLLSNLVGFLYPAWASFVAMETASTSDDKQWLTYWIVFAIFNLAEHFNDFLLYWIPFYFFFKTIFAVWLYLPQSRGAEVLYTKFVKPTLSPYIAKGQSHPAQAKGAQSSVASDVANGLKKD
ncbi:hypothetical protein M427DRAFT_112826 [Gonapodya prolifera JEL478]|uniref:Protein YOP1 n=1 Tax=Gonapodya prolifera (strain JEL478) TaxID=1344416 RepID=A0A139ABQ7_GONPJ|nr:hypothetical protein M427DRAFT_112826 [Gonapodya prolifera JEL478]|eukprot:KXS14187.1 hypothetical protein M427DRAFT_112826 [Gonapodya prolifera JEL478]